MALSAFENELGVQVPGFGPMKLGIDKAGERKI